MSSSATASAGGGISMLGLLGVILVVLKVLGMIDMSWTLVLAPFWIPAAILVVVLIVGLDFALWIKK